MAQQSSEAAYTPRHDKDGKPLFTWEEASELRYDYVALRYGNYVTLRYVTVSGPRLLVTQQL